MCSTSPKQRGRADCHCASRSQAIGAVGLEVFFSDGRFCKHPGAVPVQQTTKPTAKPLTIPSTEASSPHAGGERKCFGGISKDVTQERGLAIKVGGVGHGK